MEIEGAMASLSKFTTSLEIDEELLKDERKYSKRSNKRNVAKIVMVVEEKNN